MDINAIPSGWREALGSQLEAEYFQKLQEYLEIERGQHQVFPPQDDVFSALELTPLQDVKVLILGQDPYHDDNQAHGLSFSVQRGIKIPPSLRNIYKELHSDLGIEPPAHGCLEAWARRGVLLLNTVLTVRAHSANSHRKKGWEQFTDQVIRSVNALPNVVFVLWGRPAQTKQSLIDERHLTIESAHPSPLSARNGFFESKPFSRANAYLQSHGMEAVDWKIPE